MPELIQPTTPHTARQNKEMLAAAYIALVSFLPYVFVYGYRKPFSVATFEGIRFWGVSYQSLLIISQVIGYMLSKFYGIQFISQLSRTGRWKTGLLLMGVAWAMLFLFAIVPPPY